MDLFGIRGLEPSHYIARTQIWQPSKQESAVQAIARKSLVVSSSKTSLLGRAKPLQTQPIGQALEVFQKMQAGAKMRVSSEGGLVALKKGQVDFKHGQQMQRTVILVRQMLADGLATLQGITDPKAHSEQAGKLLDALKNIEKDKNLFSYLKADIANIKNGIIESCNHNLNALKDEFKQHLISLKRCQHIF